MERRAEDNQLLGFEREREKTQRERKRWRGEKRESESVGAILLGTGKQADLSEQELLIFINVISRVLVETGNLRYSYLFQHSLNEEIQTVVTGVNSTVKERSLVSLW